MCPVSEGRHATTGQALMHLQVSNPRVVVSSSSTQNGDFLAPSTTSFSSSTSPEAPLADHLVELLHSILQPLASNRHKAPQQLLWTTMIQAIVLERERDGERVRKART